MKNYQLYIGNVQTHSIWIELNKKVSNVHKNVAAQLHFKQIMLKHNENTHSTATLSHDF